MPCTGRVTPVGRGALAPPPFTFPTQLIVAPRLVDCSEEIPYHKAIFQKEVICMDLGTYIQQLRKERGISQESLAEQVGVSRQAVGKWEQGLSYPSTENLLALAQIFGVSADDLIGLTPAAPAPKKAFSPRWRNPLARLCMVIGWALPPPSAQPVEPIPTPAPSKPPVAETGEFSLLRLTEGGWEYLLPGRQKEAFPFGTSLLPTAMEEVAKPDYRFGLLHDVPCGEVSLSYTTHPEGPWIDLVTTIVPGWETPRGIAVGSTEEDLMAAYGDTLIYVVKDRGWDILCPHDYQYYYTAQSPEDYTPDATVGATLIFYMKTGRVAGLELRAHDDSGGEYMKVDNIFRFPVKDGRPDFSLRKEPERENVTGTWAVYQAFHRLIKDRNLSEEETYQDRLTLFGNLPQMDWLEYANMGEYEKQYETVSELLSWIWNQEIISPEERSGLIPGLENLLLTENLPEAKELQFQAQRILDEQYEYEQQ